MNETPETIAYCHACGAAMDVSAVAPFSNVACPKCGKHTRVKREFGPYTLTRRHAVGGMSMVFSAHDNTLDREVALKILSEEYSADERRIAAFEEEARITASFSHPNVVRVLRTGRAFGRYYIAMEFVPGGHFEHHIRERGMIPELEMLPLAIEVAQGLKAAHAAGLIHRDVKPGNILLDADGHAKLVDFGLALVTQGGTATATELWATPYYVPPETVDGKEEDFRSDIYAFGATLYHALAGKPPCNEESMATDRLREAKKKIIPLDAANPAISEDTCRIVMRCMEYEPTGRYASYEEMIADLAMALKHLQTGRSTTAMATASKRRSLKKRKELTAWGLGMGAIGAAVLFAVLWSGKKPAKSPASPVPPVAGAPEAPKVPQGNNDPSAQIARTFRSAQDALGRKDYDRASAGFLPLFRNSAVQEPTRSWAGVQAVMTKILGGHLAEARAMSGEIAKQLQGAQAQGVIGAELVKVMEQLGRMEPIAPPVSGDGHAGGTSSMMACMLAGLKNWEQGMPDHAAKCFAAASSVELPKKDAWAEVYRHLASDYLADYQILSGSLFSGEPKDKAGCESAVVALEGVLPTLKTKGRAHYNVRAWQLDLKRRSKLYDRPVPPKTDPLPKPGAPPSLTEVMAKLNGFSDACQFSLAASYLKSLPSDPPGASRSSLLTLVESAAVFIEDLEQDLVKEPVALDLALKSGQTVERLAVSSPGKLQATVRNGGIQNCGWADFTADALIDLHRAVVKNSPNELDRLRRNECAICYGWLVGNRELALSAASKLSQTSQSFKQRWDVLLKGLPK